MCFPVGLAGYTGTFVAQYYGTGQHARIGAAVWQGIRLGVYACPLFVAAYFAAPFIFRLAGHEASIAALEIHYFQLLMFSAPAVVISAAQSAFYSGRSRTLVVMAVDIAAVLLNIALDYLLILGRGGFPEMGIGGAAIATTIALWAKVGVYALLMFRRRERSEFGLVQGWRQDTPLLTRILRFGAPNGAQMLVEAVAFAMLIMLVGKFGKLALTATTLALNINAVAVVPMVGLGIAVSIATGQQTARKKPRLARRATRTALLIGLTYAATCSVFYLLAPGLFLSAHAAGADAANFAEIEQVTTILLRFIAVYCVLQAVQFVLSGALKGGGDTRFVLVATLVVAVVALAACLPATPWGMYWCWCVMNGWMAILCTVFAMRYAGAAWSRMSVIETSGAAQTATVASDARAVGDVAS